MHFALTSQDINNTATPMLMRDAIHRSALALRGLKMTPVPTDSAAHLCEALVFIATSGHVDKCLGTSAGKHGAVAVRWLCKIAPHCVSLACDEGRSSAGKRSEATSPPWKLCCRP